METLEWIINFPKDFISSIMPKLKDLFFEPINEEIDILFDIVEGLNIPILSLLATLLEGLLEFLNIFGENITLIEILVGGGITTIILISLVKWIIGIIT